MDKTTEMHRGKKLDRRRTKHPATIRTFPRAAAYAETPEEVRALWDSKKIVLQPRTQRFINACRDVVIVIARKDSRANGGFIDLLAIEVKRQFS